MAKNMKEGIKKQTAVICWFFTISYMGLIFYLSSLEDTELSQSYVNLICYFFPNKSPELLHPPQYFDKILHVINYAILAFLSYFSFKKSGVMKYVFLLSVVLAVLYGITDEFHQFYVAGRHASVRDVIANSVGALLGSYLANVMSVRR